MSHPSSSTPDTLAALQPGAAVHVLRHAIGEQITSAGVKLVLVRAPAGFGKTTTMAQSRLRMESQGRATAWLTLDRTDNDVSRFLSRLGEAMRRLGVELPCGSAGFDAVDAISCFDTPFALFLDDFEVVQEQAVLGLVREIIERLPRLGQIVVGSRGLPNLGLGRLRARGQLLEIEVDRLRFSAEETGLYLNRRLAARGEVACAATIERLHHKTEGWVAAIWLASMALERHGLDTGFVESFSGSDRAVAEYLADDVLAHQPPDVREFLLRSCILRQLDASACQALNPGSDSAAVLEQLANANLFLTPVEGATPAWRLHSLFADFLRAQLARERPDDVARLHLMASSWYEAQGRPVPAIDHAIEGGDHPLAMGLLETSAETFLDQGRMRMLSRWFTSLPAQQLRSNARLQWIALWAACFTRGPWVAMEMLEDSGFMQSDSAEVRDRVHALYPLLLAMQDRYDEAYEAGSQGLSQPATGLSFADGAALNALANILSVVGEPHASLRLLDAARHLQGASHFNRMYTESLEGMLDLQAGRLRQASARFRIAVDSTHAASYNHSHGNAWAGVLYAGVIYEANQLRQADHLLNVYLPLARDVGLPDHMILSHVMRSRIAFHAGDIDVAFQALIELEYLGHDRKLPRVIAGARLERSRIQLLQGHAAASRDELERAADIEVWERERRQRLPAHDLDYLALARARWQISFGDPGMALRELQAQHAAAVAVGRHRRALKLGLLRALALQRASDLAGALQQMDEVLRSASQEGFVRLILDEGPDAASLVQLCAARAQEQALAGVRVDPLFEEHLQRLLQMFGPIATAPIEAAGAPAGQEPLTRKEIRVLELLAEGYSNSAMAEKLFVSNSTVRTHLRNINAKLDAKSRMQAVVIARKQGLVR
jgi:LuxR family maltose regulon positive regulatory protein